MPKRNSGPTLKWREKNRCWEIQWFERGRRKRKSTSTACRDTAEGELAKFLIKRSAKETGQRSPDKRRIADVLTCYLLEHASELSNPENEDLFCTNLARFWGDMLVSEINTANCKAYLAHRQKEYIHYQKNIGRKTIRQISNGTVRRELEVLRAALNLDFNNERLEKVPHIWLPDRPQPRNRWLTHKEAARLLRAAKSMKYGAEYMHLYILMSLYTAARREAILTRRWTDIDFDKGLIDFGQGNGNKKRSIVPIPRKLLRELRKARLRGTDLGYVIHHNQNPIKNLKKGFAACCDAAGLEGVTPHILKHTAISWMVQKDIAIAKISKWSATSIATIEKHYGHLAPDHLHEIREAYG